MLRRRPSIRLRVVLAAALAVGIVRPLHAVPPPTGAEALARLKAGNATFVASPDAALPIDAARRAAAAAEPAPLAAVLSCSDSRVPPEVIFHAGLGDLFVVRSAGNVTDHAVLASLEYAADRLHVPLVVVMGHESCDAVKAAMDTPATETLGPNLDYLLKAIRPSVAATASTPEASRLRAAILRNVEDSVNDLANKSALLKHLWETNAVTFVGAYYELSTGRVYFSEPATPPVSAGKHGP